MRTFRLIRNQDQTGTSGTGTVATGTVDAAGKVTMRWIVQANLCDGSKKMIYTTTQYECLTDVVLLHGHNGKSYVKMDDTNIEFTDVDVLEYKKAA